MKHFIHKFIQSVYKDNFSFNHYDIRLVAHIKEQSILYPLFNVKCPLYYFLIALSPNVSSCYIQFFYTDSITQDNYISKDLSMKLRQFIHRQLPQYLLFLSNCRDTI